MEISYSKFIKHHQPMISGFVGVRILRGLLKTSIQLVVQIR